MLTLVVFGLAIVSSFAMETDPPTEPVKTTVEIEVVEDIQSPLVGYGYYDSVLDECVFLAPGTPGVNCLPTNTGVICIDTANRDLYFMSRATEHDPWVCGKVLKKP